MTVANLSSLGLFFLSFFLSTTQKKRVEKTVVSFFTTFKTAMEEDIHTHIEGGEY